jgi:hypothetical protein
VGRELNLPAWLLRNCAQAQHVVFTKSSSIFDSRSEDNTDTQTWVLRAFAKENEHPFLSEPPDL